MKWRFPVYLLLIVGISVLSCKKESNPQSPAASPFIVNTIKVNGVSKGFTYDFLNLAPVLQLKFSASINPSSASAAVQFKTESGSAIAAGITFQNGDSSMLVQPASPLQPLSKYVVTVSTALTSKDGGHLQNALTFFLSTAIDSTDKFPRISNDSLLTLVQKQTFRYFWEFGHPVSGMARERNTSGDIVTTGGTGFGIMAILVAVNRHFIYPGRARSAH